MTIIIDQPQLQLGTLILFLSIMLKTSNYLFKEPENSQSLHVVLEYVFLPLCDR